MKVLSRQNLVISARLQRRLCKKKQVFDKRRNGNISSAYGPNIASKFAATIDTSFRHPNWPRQTSLPSVLLSSARTDGKSRKIVNSKIHSCPSCCQNRTKKWIRKRFLDRISYFMLSFSVPMSIMFIYAMVVASFSVSVLTTVVKI